ncbi:MAG: HlyD family type I secretion periplasmic adaptor subunit [Sphingomonas sp.]
MTAVEGTGRTGLLARTDGFFDRVISGWNPYHPDKLVGRELEPVQIDESPVRKRGTRFIVIATLVFLVWSVTAPLDSGSQVVGSVTIAGYRKAVQHPTGGVVSRVLVTEGSKVRQGQVLVQVNPLQTDANVANIEQDYINTLVSESRAKAELLGKPIAWDPELAGLNPARVAEAKAIQVRMFQTRQSQFEEQVRGLNAQIEGLSGAIASHRIQLGTLTEELKSVRDLAKDGYVPQAQVNTTLRNQVDQQSALETAQSEIGKIRAQIAELRSQFQTEVAKELADLQKNREAGDAKLRSARFDQSLSEIRAPVSGTVVNLKVFTEGGVISAGDTLMEIVPDQGTLIVEAKVPPKDIDSVAVGQEADIRFTAFNSMTTPIVKGRVKSVGIDKQKAKPGEELRTPDDYYLAQIETTPEALKVLGDKQLRPGMPAEVLIKKGQRTFMSYLLKPILDKLARAFRD